MPIPNLFLQNSQTSILALSASGTFVEKGHILGSTCKFRITAMHLQIALLVTRFLARIQTLVLEHPPYLFDLSLDDFFTMLKLKKSHWKGLNLNHMTFIAIISVEGSELESHGVHSNVITEWTSGKWIQEWHRRRNACIQTERRQYEVGQTYWSAWTIQCYTHRIGPVI
jgi:hypothetical protein